MEGTAVTRSAEALGLRKPEQVVRRQTALHLFPQAGLGLHGLSFCSISHGYYFI